MEATETQKIYTYRDYLEWDEEHGRCELINGVVYDMTPAPPRRHRKILTELLVRIRNHLGPHARCEVYVAPSEAGPV